MTFVGFVEVKEIEKVIMDNNSGKFILSNKQLAQFKTQMSSLLYSDNSVNALKMGNIKITLVIENKEYYTATRIHGKYVEIDPNLVTKNKSSFNYNRLIFKTNSLNFDNFQKN